MKLIRKSCDSAAESGYKCVATIGNFDGIHLGHQTLILALKKYAKAHNLPTAVITFEPPPNKFFLQEKAPVRLMGFREKFEALQALEIDYLCVLRFNLKMAHLPAEDFVKDILIRSFGIQHIIVGQDFRFGKERTGDWQVLQTLGQSLGFSVSIAPLLLHNGQKVSSTRIREALATGNPVEAQNLLKR